MLTNIICNVISYFGYYLILGLLMPLMFHSTYLANVIGSLLAFLVWAIINSIRIKKYAWWAWKYLPDDKMDILLHYYDDDQILLRQQRDAKK